MLGPDLRPVGVGVVGRLARRGHIPLGYYKDAAKTEATFPVVDGVRWAVPGDHAVVETDGTITLLGRGSVSINTGGEKVYPEEVESVLKAHADVFDAVVVGVPDERWGERVVAIVQSRTGTAPTLDALQHPQPRAPRGLQGPARDRARRRDRTVAVRQARLPVGPGRGHSHSRYGRSVTRNRLAGETSPYLRQHADNPVDWMPWGDEAFALARERDVPVFLSVGYSSCHWCHVMAHESFEDDATAALMNSLFVNVKVDREERPDVDAIYMQSVQALTGRGGWPMSVWCTPDGRPFYAGTYFPDADRHGMPSFRRVCEAVSEAWRERRDEVTEQSEQLTAALAEDVLRADADAGVLDAEILERAYAGVRAQFEPNYGGFGRAPKFPQAMTIDFLCRAYVRNSADETRTMITTTLDAMAAGGIHDQLGGGFARYSTDDTWLVPHFEKMLYDNALLTRAYLHAFLVTGEARYRGVVEDIVEYVLRDMQSP